MLSLYLNLAFRLGTKTTLLLRKYLKYYFSCLETILLDGPIVDLAYPLPPPVFHHSLGRPVRLTGWPDSSWLPGGLPGRLSDSQIAGKHPSVIDRQSCRANPLGHPAGAHAGRTFCDPRTSCGDTNGDTCTLVLYVFGCQNLAEIG